jgi:hypothetical protein
MTMGAHGDDAKVTELLAPLRRLEPVPFPGERRPLPRRPVLVAAVLVAALALVGVAIADGVGAFDGIGAAQRAQNGSDVLDSRVTRSCSSDGPVYDPFCHLVPSSVRLIGTFAGGRKVFVVADTRGDLCVVDESRTIASSCGPPLSRSHPITGTFANDSPTTGGEFVAGGVARDGVASVSFTVSGRDVTVPVQDNVWLYEQAHSHATDASCIVAHLADGSTVDPFPEAPCARRRG